MPFHHKRHSKRHPRIQRRSAPGASPGTIAVDPTAAKSTISLIAYGPDQFIEVTLRDAEKIRDYLGKYPVTWINIDGLGDAATIEKIGAIFGLHKLALEDVVNTHQRAKVEEYGDQLFIVARMADLELRTNTEQLGMFVGQNFVLTFQEAAGDCWQPVRTRIRSKVGRIRTVGADYLAYALLDACIDAYFPVLEQLGERLATLEELVLERPDQATRDQIHEVMRGLVLLRRAIWPHREAMASLIRESTPVFTEATRVYLRDCYDHVIQIIDLTETYRELASDLRDLYMSSVSNRINETMRVLTIIATIFMPLTFIAGIYGMNFEHMPELHWLWGYPLSLLLMTLITAGMLLFFWQQGWLSNRKAVSQREAE